MYPRAEENRARCSSHADKIRDLIWSRRGEFLMDYSTIESFIDRVESCKKPVMLVDSGDVTTRGVTDRNFRKMAFTKITRPICPLDDIQDYKLSG